MPKLQSTQFEHKFCRKILNYELNDVFIVNGQEYYINSITTNLLTNKSQLELITKQSAYTPSVLT